MWILVESSTRRIVAAGHEPLPPVNDPEFAAVRIPNQDLSIPGDEYRTIRSDLHYPEDVRTHTDEDMDRFVDRDTDTAIGKEIHPLAPVGEQIGILRDQLVQILNALGIEATADFARLNEAAAKAIEEARAKKEAL